MSVQMLLGKLSHTPDATYYSIEYIFFLTIDATNMYLLLIALAQFHRQWWRNPHELHNIDSLSEQIGAYNVIPDSVANRMQKGKNQMRKKPTGYR